MKLQIRTMTGSTYILDKDQMTWERVFTALLSGPLRTVSGKLTVWPVIKLGESMDMECPPFVEGAILRLVSTSEVMSITAMDDAADDCEELRGGKPWKAQTTELGSMN